MTSPLKKPEGIAWNAAAVELPEIPTVSAGQDAMSATIAAVLPTLAAELTANVAALSAKEHTFSGKVGAAQVAYQNADDAGSQSVGQIVGMLGQAGQQAGQMGQMAGAPAQALGGQTGMFGSLMQQATQGAQAAGGQGAAATAPSATGATGGLAGQAPRDDAELRGEAGEPEPAERDDREAHQPLHRADDRPWDGASGPERGTGAGPSPISPPESPRGEDIARSL
ncbi:hypothetical protein [Mycobacterium sp. E740]|uniref:hypothetical protein n=1 Tax=Mycobacterium sp. E740 TaxID=1834149 RepID=UPI000801DB17|nr:hypothetical protein [Mycobacterium sp. E740]OBI78196.1 hypothetical protein A5663_20775 [Mycobacterium sp. E740]